MPTGTSSSPSAGLPPTFQTVLLILPLPDSEPRSRPVPYSSSEALRAPNYQKKAGTPTFTQLHSSGQRPGTPIDPVPGCYPGLWSPPYAGGVRHLVQAEGDHFLTSATGIALIYRHPRTAHRRRSRTKMYLKSRAPIPRKTREHLLLEVLPY